MSHIVSIIIPAYQAAPTIGRTLESLQWQRGVELDIVVVEDGVLDLTAQVIKKYRVNRHISLDTNQGACYARNIGLEAIVGDYVMFLDADDYLEGEFFLKKMLDIIKAKQTSLVLGRCKKLWERSGKTRQFTPPENETQMQLLFRWFCGYSGPAPCSVIWRKKEIERIGGWNESYSKNQDGELMIRAMLSGCTLSQSYEGTGVYVQHDGQRVSDRADDKAFECLSRLEGYLESRLSDKDMLLLKPALATYQLQVGLRALTFNRSDIAQGWLTRWSQSRTELGIKAFQQLGVKYIALNFLCMLLGPSRFLRFRKLLAH